MNGGARQGSGDLYLVSRIDRAADLCLATPAPQRPAVEQLVRRMLGVLNAGAGMKRFYPEATVEVIGTADPEYKAFVARLDAQPQFIDRQSLDDALLAYTFHPRGWMLRSDPRVAMPPADTLVIEEEEVQRIGATLKRKFQYARSSDGRAWLWLGRSKTAGRGEARSALR